MSFRPDFGDLPLPDQKVSDRLGPKRIGLDLEVSSPKLSHGKIPVAVWGTVSPYKLHTASEYPGTPKPWKDMSDLLFDLASQGPAVLVGHNLIFDLLRLGIDSTNLRDWDLYVFDTMWAGWLLNENNKQGLAATHERLFGRILPKPLKVKDNEVFIDLSGTLYSLKDQPLPYKVQSALCSYCIEDVVATLKVGQVYEEALKTVGKWDYYWGVEWPYYQVLLDMHWKKLRIDMPERQALSKQLTTAIDTVKHEIYIKMGYKFNIDSPKQVGSALFSKAWKIKVRQKAGKTKKTNKQKYKHIEITHQGLGLPKQGFTRTGQPSTDNASLQAVADNDIVRDILRYREWTKLLRTYVEGFTQWLDKDGTLWPNWRRTGTVTGRLSSSSPNLQNIPIRSELGKKVRNLVIPKDGHVFVVADLEQIEYRLLASYSGEPDLLQAFEDGKDIHQQTGELIADASHPGVRHIGKTLNYAVCYGAGPRKVAEILAKEGFKFTTKQCKEFIDKYNSRLPRVRDWIERVKADAKQGNLTTWGGRTRQVLDIDSHNPPKRYRAERQAVNAVIQGSAADILQQAMVSLFEEKELVPTLQVHDELVYEVEDDEDKIQEVCDAIKDTFSRIPIFPPVETSIKVVSKWGEAK